MEKDEERRANYAYSWISSGAGGAARTAGSLWARAVEQCPSSKWALSLAVKAPRELDFTRARCRGIFAPGQRALWRYRCHHGFSGT